MNNYNFVDNYVNLACHILQKKTDPKVPAINKFLIVVLFFKYNENKQIIEAKDHKSIPIFDVNPFICPFIFMGG